VLFRSGFAGVSLFFTLSGVVLAMSYEGKVDSVGGVARFYWARLTRIVPLWFLVSFPILFLKNFEGEGYFEFITFTQAWSLDRSISFGYLAVAWTLSVEMFFYAVFPLLAWIAGALHKAKIAGIVLVLVGVAIPICGVLFYLLARTGAIEGVPISISPHWLLYRLPAMRLGDFITGIGLFYLAKEIPALRRIWYVFVALGLAGVVAAVWATDAGPWTWDAVWIVPFSLLLFGLLVAPQTLTEKTPRLAIILGEASFALYLIHHRFIIPFYAPMYGDPVQHPIAASVSIVVIAICASIGLFIAFERPVMSILRNPFRTFSPLLKLLPMSLNPNSRRKPALK